MTNQIQATETETKEIMALLPEEIQDFLAESALQELQEAKKVPFTPVEDAQKLDLLINSVNKKLIALLSIDVAQALKKDLQGFAQLETEDGETNPIALIDQVTPSLDAIISIEAKISTAISRLQKTLVECLKMKRLLSGQMYGTRLAHSAQASRTTRTRKITVTGNDLLQELSQGAQVNPKLEMETIIDQKPKVVELFPAQEIINATFEPLPDVLPYQTLPTPEAPKNKEVQQDQDDGYCSTYED